MKLLYKDTLRDLWAKANPITRKGKQYLVCRMSYGDYFLEPYNPNRPEGRGEREPIVKGTHWLPKHRLAN